MHLEEFKKYLGETRNMSDSTVEAYGRDAAEFADFAIKRGNAGAEEATGTDVIAYLHRLKTAGRTMATINRKLASVRAYYNFLISIGAARANPTLEIRTPKVEMREPVYLTIKEMDTLLSLPDRRTPAGMRDRAILETLYATGVRATELVEANVDNVNLRMGFITCDSEDKARIVPLGRPARAALEDYIYEARHALLKRNPEEQALFVNFYGKRMTRQGLWKIIKTYGEEAGLEYTLTPSIIRNTFAVHMLQNGADVKSLQELMGSEDISATHIYLSVTKNRIKDVYDKAHPRA